MRNLAHILFAVGMAGLGILSLIFRDFALNWQPVPTWVPFREYLACASGAILVATGIGMLVRPTAMVSTLFLFLFVLAWLLLLQVPRVVADPANEGMWLGFGENLVLVSGGWTLFAFLAKPGDRWNVTLANGDVGLRIGRVLFGLSLPLIGLSHFIYVNGTASMVPAWLPDRTGFAYLTGAGHIAAGVGLLISVAPRLAVTLEAIMMSLFVLLIHVPGVTAEPTSRLQWTMLFVAAALTGAGWAVAGSFLGVPWSKVGWPRRKDGLCRSE